MKLKNKIFLSLGTTTSVIAPIATAASCTTVKEISETAIEQRELWSKSQNIIETRYQETLIEKISADGKHETFGKAITIAELQKYEDLINNKRDEILNGIKSMVKRNIYINPSYLSTIAEKLLHTVNPNAGKAANTGKAGDFFTYAELVKDGFYDYYLSNTDVSSTLTDPTKAFDATSNPYLETKVDNLVDKYMPVIWNENTANFKNVFYQYVISSYFLDTTKSNWRAVFTDAVGAVGKITGLEGNLKDESFVLGQKLLRAKLGYDWAVSLDDSASKAYANVKKTETDLNASLTKNGDVWKDATTTQQRSMLPSFVWDQNGVVAAPATKADERIWNLIDENKNLIGFNGLVDKSTFASYDSKMKQVTDLDTYDVNYEGFVNKESSIIVNDKDATNKDLANPDSVTIKLTTPSNSKVDIEKVVMLMPTYVNGEMSLDFLKDSKAAANGGDAFTTVKNILISKQGSDIYKEAIQYYSSKDNKEYNWDADKKVGGIRLTIKDESLRKVATDTFALDYVNKDE